MGTARRVLVGDHDRRLGLAAAHLAAVVGAQHHLAALVGGGHGQGLGRQLDALAADPGEQHLHLHAPSATTDWNKVSVRGPADRRPPGGRRRRGAGGDRGHPRRASRFLPAARPAANRMAATPSSGLGIGPGDVVAWWAGPTLGSHRRLRGRGPARRRVRPPQPGPRRPKRPASSSTCSPGCWSPTPRTVSWPPALGRAPRGRARRSPSIAGASAAYPAAGRTGASLRPAIRTSST